MRAFSIMTSFATLAVTSACLSGCASTQRTPEVYHADVKTMLDSQNEPIRICYEKVLKKDPKAAGTVVVHFLLFATGVNMTNDYGTTDRGLVKAKTTAPSEVSDCVLEHLRSLQLDPVDKAYGDVYWTWEFSSTSIQLTPTVHAAGGAK